VSKNSQRMVSQSHFSSGSSTTISVISSLLSEPSCTGPQLSAAVSLKSFSVLIHSRKHISLRLHVNSCLDKNRVNTAMEMTKCMNIHKLLITHYCKHVILTKNLDTAMWLTILLSEGMASIGVYVKVKLFCSKDHTDTYTIHPNLD